MKTRIRLARGTNANIKSNSTLSTIGHPIFDKDKNYLYVGDGSSSINALAPLTSNKIVGWDNYQSSTTPNYEFGATTRACYVASNHPIAFYHNLELSNNQKILQLEESAVTTYKNITYSMYNDNAIPFKVYGGDAYGLGVSVGGGGSTIIGSGESNNGCETLLSSGSEELWLTSDNKIRFYTNCQYGIANRIGTALDISGNFYPETAGSGSIGTSANTWNSIYVNTINATNLGSTLVPSANNTINLGSSAYKFNTIYATTFNGTATKAKADESGNTIANTYAQLATFSQSSATQIGDFIFPKLKLISNTTLTSTSSDTSATATFTESVSANDLLAIEVSIYRTGKYFIIGNLYSLRLFTADIFNGVGILSQAQLNITSTSIQLGKTYTWASSGSPTTTANIYRVYKIIVGSALSSNNSNSNVSYL